MTALALGISISAIEKLAYSQPRPFIFNTEIHALVCAADFGNPCSHSAGSIFVFVLLYLDVFHGAKLPKFENIELHFY